MPRHVTRIVVTELPIDALNPEPHLVEWTVDGKDFRHQLDSYGGAARLVGNLLKQLAPGLTKDDVLVVKRR